MPRKKKDLASLARTHTEMAVRTLAHIAKAPKAQDSARIAACNSLLDRGWGKPAQVISGDEDKPLKMIVVTGVPQPGDDAVLIEHDDATLIEIPED